MIFTTKAGENVRDDVKRSSGGGEYIQNVKDGKDLRVRFLQEPEDWVKYREHYSDDTKFVPCAGSEEECPACRSSNDKLKKSSRRYACNVLDVKEGKVIALKLPVDLANRVIAKCDRNGGTLLNRDLTLIRMGKGLDTTYDVEVEDKVQMDLTRFKTDWKDIEGLLEVAYNDTWGEDKPAEPVDRSKDLTVDDLNTPATEEPKEDEPNF